MTVTTNDSISFYRKVSSGDSYDFMRFYIDGSLKKSWSGSIDWGREVFAVQAGSRTFKWVYSKDGMISQYDDCAWIDNIVFPAVNNIPPELSCATTEIFKIMKKQAINRNREWYRIKPKLEMRLGQNLDEFDKEINDIILKTWRMDW
jgi:hypothetical protein